MSAPQGFSLGRVEAKKFVEVLKGCLLDSIRWKEFRRELPEGIVIGGASVMANLAPFGLPFRQKIFT